MAQELYAWNYNKASVQEFAIKRLHSCIILNFLRLLKVLHERKVIILFDRLFNQFKVDFYRMYKLKIIKSRSHI